MNAKWLRESKKMRNQISIVVAIYRSMSMLNCNHATKATGAGVASAIAEVSTNAGAVMLLLMSSGSATSQLHATSS